MAMTEIPAPPPPTPDPEPNQIPFEPAEPAQVEPAQAPAPVEPEPKAAPVAAQSEAAPAAPAEADPIQAALEEVRLQLEEQQLQQKLLEKQLEHERILRDEAASKAGYYKRVATDLAATRRQQVAQPPVEDYGISEEEPAARVAPETARFQQEIQSLREDAIERAQQEAVMHFFSANPDAREMVKDMEPFVVQARERYAEWIDSGEPKLIRKAAVMVLDTAYLNAQKAKTAAKRTATLTARASQLQRLAEEKRAAAIPGSGTAAPPGPQPKTIDKLDPYGKELEDILNNWR